MSNDRPSSDLTVPAATGAVSARGDVPERFENPGLPPHQPRRADSEPAADKRAERQVVALFGVSILGTIGVIVTYFVYPHDPSIESMRTANMLLGIGLFLGMFGIGAAAVHWAKTLMSDHEQAEARHPQRSDAEVRAGALQALSDGAQDSGIGRRGLLKGAVVSAVALAPLSIAVPLIGQLGGDWDVSKFRHTMWRSGTRLARDPSGTPIRAADVTIGSVYHVIPEDLRESDHWIEEKAKAIVLLVRLDPQDLVESDERRDWSHEGIVAYSKVCTHVGCPVALYEQQTHHLLCPCHQSTFDMADGAKVVFGPASRALPQLPITVDDAGYLVAQSDFHEPVGPSYWERLK
ncbi:ubiquinol-cytochrome c reductase iron-sulfur subunit [Actinotalea sp. K2]|uniref:cytochrome bc1 complex Rieske iron-sulfur subunit n=1 Tax=Actinotalea sp. K2 TaxID=2939438 RepID=UPI002017D6CC|nr:Rieske 2Fe-2S domain-containing protein [Actinotalea sp. K2]MCL3862162.1 Rieske (2Fe-2S) protein [Actinotalea sp. K2]